MESGARLGGAYVGPMFQELIEPVRRYEVAFEPMV